jgi:anti-anti-sigma regulatory factor
MSVRITNKADGTVLGDISEEDFLFLVDQLEEESSHDTDYFIDLATVEILESAGGGGSLVSMLRSAVGSSDGIDIAWKRV